MLAMQAGNSSSSSELKNHVMDVANAPGEKIYPGEITKGLKILADGGQIDYEGASAVNLIGPVNLLVLMSSMKCETEV